jgi:hypothetical protein
MRNIFVGLCYSLENSRQKDFKSMKSKFITETIKSEITKQSFGPELEKGKKLN